LITSSRELAKVVQTEVQRRTRANPIAASSLSRHGAILLVASLDDAVETANRIAPEHLTLPAALAPAVQNAGSIFLNEFTPQSAGDYISGPNHVLPTGAMARVRGGLSVLDFVRIISCQEVSREGIRRIATPTRVLAEAEGLSGHAESLRVRCSHA
jgi:histidinol dehydrogenase